MASSELKKIKKIYGEDFMHMCRSFFPEILDAGELLPILQSIFAGNSRDLYDDIVNSHQESNFKDCIYEIYEKQKERAEKSEVPIKTPYEILDEVGYDLYECTTEEEIQSYKKYYKPNEELCTFRGGRLQRCVVFWAVKKNANDIKREDFVAPQREDEYGTSVMSIQFDREGKNIVSIKNRYNHTVSNPDATYGNDLNRIAPGLEESFEPILDERIPNRHVNSRLNLSYENYVIADDGKYYKYNICQNNIYYCPRKYNYR